MTPYPRSKRAFSLVEILVVLAIMSILMGIGMKAFSGQGSQEFSKGLSQLSGALELAQAQSLSTRNLIRLLIAMDDQDLVILSLTYTGDASASEEKINSDDDSTWTPTAKPLIIKNMKLNEEFIPQIEDFSLLSEGTPLGITRNVAGKEVQFESMIQFSPQGEASLNSVKKIGRGIQCGVQSLGTKPQKAIIRISSLTGRIEVLREESFATAASSQ